ncbi:hypothetical protein HBH98_001020 [Parastagonospora nodorum]|nr:hypothetical protein HBH53_176590 [Parastagonospora nodorum]KAH3970428.1 hypothetical protein HBH52_168300 [Parastagonospora nodorum]KAH3996829.1 hypothetical protein HBI10_150580 [Parastagonospora nodorum]KAH4009150.1 hypothetical protein HBI13_224650 [Parastagonospora nodorum]KAH4353103.1 hypothetical protein HBH98_001020 [Parastagonospora nodorum]
MSCILHRLGKVCTEHENKRFPLFSSEPLLHSCIGATRTQHKTQLFIPPFLFFPTSDDGVFGRHVDELANLHIQLR